MFYTCVQSGMSTVCNAFTDRDSTTSGANDRPTEITLVIFCIIWHPKPGWQMLGSARIANLKMYKIELGHRFTVIALKDKVECIFASYTKATHCSSL